MSASTTIATPADLRAAILPLDPGGPIHRQLETDLARGRPSRAWYCCQQEHLLGWLAEYAGPGAYGRANPNRSAAFVYGAFQCAPGLAWMAEAAGVNPALVTAGCDAVRAAGPRHAAQCGAFRRVVPWAMVERALSTPAPAERLPKPLRNQTRKPARSVNQPPRPATLPPAATVARTWMMGSVGVSFSI